MSPPRSTDFDDWLVFQGDRAGLIDDATARQRLLSLTRHLEKDRSILTHSEFFNTEGLRMKIEEIGTH